MQRTTVLRMVLVLAAVFAIAGCGSKYDDVEAVLDTEIDVMSTFIDDMKSAGSADDVAAAIGTYAEGMEKLVPQLKEITRTYPNLKNGDDIPDDLKAKMDRIEELIGQFPGTMMKATGFMTNPKVQKAWEGFGQVMAAMGEAS